MNLPILFIQFAILCPPPEPFSDDLLRAKYDPNSGILFFDKQTTEVATAKGRKRAEADYAAGEAEIEVFGLWMGSSNVDKDTGLYIRKRGCTIINSAGVESDAYNERLRELIEKHGPSKSMQDLKKRFEKSQTFETDPPKLEWKQIPAESEDQPATTTAGDYSLQFVREIDAEVVRQNLSLPPTVQPRPVEKTYIKITRGESLVGELPVHGNALLSDSMEAAYWPEVSLIVFNRKGKTNIYQYFDVIHGRLMWETNHMQRLVNELKDLSNKPATAPVFPREF